MQIEEDMTRYLNEYKNIDNIYRSTRRNINNNSSSNSI